MPRKKPYRYRPRKLRFREIGAERCERLKGGLRLCVKANKYGYTGKLYAKNSDMWLPVSVGRARSMKSAMSAAKQFVRRVKMKSR